MAGKLLASNTHAWTLTGTLTGILGQHQKLQKPLCSQCSFLDLLYNASLCLFGRQWSTVAREWRGDMTGMDAGRVKKAYQKLLLAFEQHISQDSTVEVRKV